METLEIHWITPKLGDANSSLVRDIRRSRMTTKSDKSDWSERLGFCPAEVVKKTLKSTTQLCSAPVEMENWDSPRQHRKSRIHPLHPPRIQGRMDSDTFFYSMLWIMGYTCVQLFYVLLSQFILGRLMRRESHSHGAYQDFI